MEWRKQSGFTLVELLVCVAVIGILASILIAVLGAVREKSLLTNSISNVRNIGGGTQMYAQEHDNNIPVWHNYNTGQYWWQLLLPYLGDDTEIFHSPAHEEFNDTDYNTLAQTISYGWNYVVMGRHLGDTSREGDHVLSQFIFADPSKTLVLADGPKTDCWGYIAPDHPADPDRYGNNLVVALFLDGHVDTLDYTEVTTEEPYFVPIRNMPDFK
ncbi:type II secretion system protein [Cerasicoccus maritimus]|uniref:type II secretion system protein n=1 Tax=Cerasicoccus maritimus TaxID=490089 RepID=UPI002852A9C9|nr:type II secretion system protein [Cerasicoccus maritimus]